MSIVVVLCILYFPILMVLSLPCYHEIRKRKWDNKFLRWIVYLIIFTPLNSIFFLGGLIVAIVDESIKEAKIN